MNLVHETKLSVFTEVPENKELNVLYSLNQQNTPEVGGLESINDLSKLIKMSAINFYVLEGNKIIGFAICFRENSEYKSPNYKYFKNKEDKFLYIDRVVIKTGFRRNGLGTKIYEFLKRTASKELLPICCEVNSDPPNDISIKFHTKNGFKKIGKREFADHSVIYFIK